MSTTTPATGPTTDQTTTWSLKGVGYEFCNCDPGCTCNFAGFPSSDDGSCQALVASVISEGHCGDVDLSGITAAALLAWPGLIHDGGGKAVFVVEPDTTEEQVGSLAQIFTGQLGGNPWAILGTTFEVGGLVTAPITISGQGLQVALDIAGVGRAQGDVLRNPVTGEPHEAHITLPTGFIWKDGNCGVGSFRVEAEGIALDFEDANWILYDFDWAHDR